jgi:thiamine pyrophosphokinase
MKRYAVLLGGDVIPTRRLNRQLAGATVFAADSGMRHAVTLNLKPVLWLGDFDSADPHLIQKYSDVERVVFPSAKDATDGEIAINEALKRGANEIILVGSFGGQFDHVLTHATSILALASRDVSTIATSGNEEAYALLSELNLPGLEAGTRLSVVALSALHGLSISGVAWPLKKANIPMGSSQTLSNEIVGDVSLSLEHGQALVIVYPKPDAA